MGIMVTGHRKLVPAGHTGSPWPDQNPSVRAHHDVLRQTMAGVITNWHQQSGWIDCISGMALGADTLFAEAVLEVKRMGFPVRLIAAVPFAGQESKWTAKAQTKFREILSQADHVEIVSQGAYAPNKMQIRNKWMVDRALPVLAVWDGRQSGGTWNCIKYALQQGKWVMQLNPQTFQMNVLEKGMM